MPEALVPLVVLLAILAIDLWVYADARRWAAQGAPVVARIGSFAVETPEMWFLGCLVLFIGDLGWKPCPSGQGGNLA